MKTIRYTSILAVLTVVFVGCHEKEPVPTKLSSYCHMIAVSIMDPAGNDLLFPLWEEQWMPEGRAYVYDGTINPERYELEIERPGHSPLKCWLMEERKKLRGPYFLVGNFYDSSQYFREQYGETYDMYVLANFYANIKENGTDVIEMDTELTYRITCPTVFGDNEPHNLVTYWEESEDRIGMSAFPKCIRAVYDGKEIQVEKIPKVWEDSSGNGIYYLMRIVLNE